MIELYPLLRPALFALEAERAHALSLAALRLGLGPRPAPAPAPELAQDLMGLRFANPIGLAAGYDKDAIAPDALIRLGFGFVEVGTVTPRPQAGNLRPRVFRLPADRAVINRLGFNSAGQATVRERLAARRFPGVLGVNIGANAASRDRVADYAAGAAAFAGIADYLTINVSSPNTPALRELQGSGELGRLLAAVRAARGERRLPVLVKIAPDLSAREIATVVETAIAGGADGLVVSNTTAGRPALREALLAAEPGGLSGAPLFDLSTKVLARARAVAGDRLTLIGVGGVGSAEQALAKIAAGASLVQLYTAMVYEGPGLAARIVGALPGLLRKAGFAHVSEAVGSDIDRYDTLEGR